MDKPTTSGLDLAKSVFQVHGVSEDGAAVLRRQLRRGQVLAFFARLEPCRIGMEACSGAHHWARERAALSHEVRLMPAACVKPYVKRGKTDRADAEAICEAVTRPTMRFVPVKSTAAQAALLDHVAPKARLRRNARDFLIRQQTRTVNTTRAHLAEFGIVVAKGIHGEEDQKTVHWGLLKKPDQAIGCIDRVVLFWKITLMTKSTAAPSFLRFMAMAVSRACIFMFPRPRRMALPNPWSVFAVP
jgi:transposase